jgi:Putative PD-(D/E)XK phosphodiesterase (DUF2161)
MPDAPKILLRNVYGWFTRVERGLYALSDSGAQPWRNGRQRSQIKPPNVYRTPKLFPFEDRDRHFVLLIDDRERRELLFFSRRLRVTNLGCTRTIVKSTPFSEGTRIPTPDAEECMFLDDLSLGAASSGQFATDITLRAKCKQPPMSPIP